MPKTLFCLISKYLTKITIIEQKKILIKKMYFLLKFVDSGLKWLSGVGPVSIKKKLPISIKLFHR